MYVCLFIYRLFSCLIGCVFITETLLFYSWICRCCGVCHCATSFHLFTGIFCASLACVWHPAPSGTLYTRVSVVVVTTGSNTKYQSKSYRSTNNNQLPGFSRQIRGGVFAYWSGNFHRHKQQNSKFSTAYVPQRARPMCVALWSALPRPKLGAMLVEFHNSFAFSGRSALPIELSSLFYLVGRSFIGSRIRAPTQVYLARIRTHSDWRRRLYTHKSIQNTYYALHMYIHADEYIIHVHKHWTAVHNAHFSFAAMPPVIWRWR